MVLLTWYHLIKMCVYSTLTLGIYTCYCSVHLVKAAQSSLTKRVLKIGKPQIKVTTMSVPFAHLSQTAKAHAKIRTHDMMSKENSCSELMDKNFICSLALEGLRKLYIQSATSCTQNIPDIYEYLFSDERKQLWSSSYYLQSKEKK